MTSTPWTLATWNVNSVKMRADAVAAWIGERRPDLLALQELKLTEADFPSVAFAGSGYGAAIHGQKTYNGVALLSREAIEDVSKGLPEMADDPQSRLIKARRGDVTVINVYVPNGSEVGSEKYAYKLRWLEALARHLEGRHRPEEPLAIVGDFNVAPEARDIYDPVAFQNQVLFSEPERAALGRLLDWGLVDLFRKFHDEEGLYSWWDYRAAAFRRKLGARIDLILVTRSLADRALRCEIDIEPRRREKPSDHTPVWAEFG
jgi:exodeoxyribonuclease-3